MVTKLTNLCGETSCKMRRVLKNNNYLLAHLEFEKSTGVVEKVLEKFWEIVAKKQYEPWVYHSDLALAYPEVLKKAGVN